MTLVQNRLQQLSGNKRLIFATIGLLAAACSPKVVPVATPVKRVDTPAVVIKKPVENKRVEQQKAPAPVISLLLPFHLNELDLNKGVTRASLAKANLAMEYYQGFKLGLDSLTAVGESFKLRVFDTNDAAAQAHNLALNNKVRTSSIIVGPVYPEEVKSFTLASPSLKKMVVSPLSPATPTGYKNPNLVTVITPLQYHCWRVAGYVTNQLKAKIVFILKSGFSDDNKYSIPFKKAIDSLSKKRVKVVELTVVRGDLTPLVPQLSNTANNVFVIPATNQQFLQVTLHSLDMLQKKHYPVTVFGHPNWEDADYLKAELLERLHTYITSGDRVNYKSARVAKFLKAYRKAYHAEPGEYALKGFDEALYFGDMASKTTTAKFQSNPNDNAFNLLPAGTVLKYQDFEGLHNVFHFTAIPGVGYVNTHVTLYKYANFDLKPVE